MLKNIQIRNRKIPIRHTMNIYNYILIHLIIIIRR